MIAENKYGSSSLKPKTKDGPQMSDDWINGRNRLDNAVGVEKADLIREEMITNPQNIQKVLSEIDTSGNVTMYKINPDGSKEDLWF